MQRGDSSGEGFAGDAGEGPNFAKLLVNTNVINNTLNAIRTQAGCMVKVSNSAPADAPAGPQQFFPGASDRVVLLSGQKHGLEQAVIMITAGVRDATLANAEAMRSDQAAPGMMELRFVVPNSTVSLIIGKGGSRINQLREATGAKIQVSSREPSGRMESERIINVSGDFENVKGASIMIIAIIQEDPAQKDFLYLSYPTRPTESGSQLTSPPAVGRSGAYSSAGNTGYGNTPEASPGAGGSVLQINQAVLDIHTDIYLQIPDDFVGSLVGRNGQHLCDIRSTSGARVSISQRGELVPGTRDRLVTVSGSIRAVHTAHILIIQRLAELQDAMHRGETGMTR